MISKLSFARGPSTRRSLVSADGAAWRIKPEIRTLARIIAERQAAERTNPFGGYTLKPIRGNGVIVWRRVKSW